MGLDISLPAPPDATDVVRPLRKGTRSCKECRRRKTRCIYPEGRPLLCEECERHDRGCVRQGIVGSSASSQTPSKFKLRVRVAKLESIIERLAKTQTENTAALLGEQSAPIQQQSADASEENRRFTELDLAELDSQSHARSPLFMLFDNDLLTRNDTSPAPPASLSNTINFGWGMKSDQEKLLSAIAREPNAMNVLRVGGGWWVAWQNQYPGLKDLDVARSLHDYVTFHLSQDKPVLIAIGLLCMAMSLQHIRPGIDETEDLHLSMSPYDLMTQILAAVDSIVVSNEKSHECKDGLLVLLLRAKVHVESNQIRKCWLRMRQAILAAQNIDLAMPRSSMSTQDLFIHQRFMGGLFETDRFLSLVLGFPYAVDDNFTDRLASQVLQDFTDIRIRMRALRRVVAVAAGRVNDRNATTVEPSIEVTRSIQHSLETAALSMPSIWWHISRYTENMVDPQLTHENLMTQLWFHQTQALLHLPFMLKVSPEPQYEENRSLCLHAARCFLRIYHVMTQDPTLAAYTCKCDDFQCLLAAIILLVGLLQYTSQGMELPERSFRDDMDIIETTKEVFRFGSQQQGGSVAKQGLRVLDSLSAFLLEDGADSGVEADDAGRSEITLFVPYFGAISVQKTRPTQRKPLNTSTKQDNQLPTPPSAPTPFGYDTDYYAPEGDSTNDPQFETGFPSSTDYDNLTFTKDGYPNQWPFEDNLSLPELPFDWNNMMLGTELEQDWNNLN